MLPGCSSSGNNIHPHGEISLKCLSSENNLSNRLKKFLFIEDTTAFKNRGLYSSIGEEKRDYTQPTRFS